jgi:hypothetical protein
MMSSEPADVGSSDATCGTAARRGGARKRAWLHLQSGARMRSLAISLPLALLIGIAFSSAARAQETTGGGGLLTAGTQAAAGCASPPVTADGPCGMDLEDAWSHYTTGDPRELVAYIEGGINWHLAKAKELVDSIYVNWHELPVPCTGSTMVVGTQTRACELVYSNSVADYDLGHDGVVNVEDWANDPRVHDANGNGYLDPEDLIAAFSNNVDHDGDGYPNDISGYDFYDSQNDPATEDSTYDHSDEQMLVIHRECPKCMIMPVRAGNEALDRTGDLAKAWEFAGDAGASVIVSVTADLDYSSFMREVISELEGKGVAMVEASNDFDSTDHQGGMFWPYVIPGNGALPNESETAWTRSDYTSWGAHNVLTGPTHGGTTSESTPTIGGAIALLQSWGLQAAEKHLISSALTGPEAEQELIATAKRVVEPSLAWPGAPGEWNPQYGYGIPNVYSAMKAVAEGIVAPLARIESPAWYSLFDPTKAFPGAVAVTGTVQAPRSPSFHWVLQAGLGGDPQSWSTIGAGTGHGSFSGRLGTLDPREIPESFWSAAFGLSKTKELETAEQYAVTLRVAVTDASGRVGVDRRAINVVHDPSWMSGFPIQLSSGAESQPALVDLQGSGHLDAVFGTADGYVEAIDPKTGSELPGWPVHTDPTPVLVPHPGVNPRYEAILSDVAVGDLDHTGALSVVATTQNGSVFVWNAKGELEPGWPQVCDTGVAAPPIPRPALPYTRLPTQGVAAGGPVLYDLAGTGELDVIVAGWDGYIHVWQPDGLDLPGWPVKVQLPEGFKPAPGYSLIDDHKLDTAPAIAYLEGRSSSPDLVVRPQYSEIPAGSGEELQTAPLAFAFAYHANGTPMHGWPVKYLGAVEYYNSAEEFLTEGASDPVVADPSGNGSGPDDVAIAPAFTPPYLIDGAGHIVGAYLATATSASSGSHQLLTQIAATGAFGKVGQTMSFATTEMGAKSLAGALMKAQGGEPIEYFESSFPVAGGAASPGFPVTRQGADFFGEPIIAPVTPSGSGAVIEGGDSDALMAYNANGQMAPGFPKWTTGWTMFSPAAGDLLSNGRSDLVSVTREGYLFAWETNGPASADAQWWHTQHDEWNTGNYEAVTRPPGAIQSAHWYPRLRTVTFTAPGATWYEGKPSSYDVTLEPQHTMISLPATVSAGHTQTLRIPASPARVAIQAVGPTGLLGAVVALE